MSIKVMSRVWTESKQRGGALLVLLAIADFANDDGLAFPSVQTLATKARLGERQVHRILCDLRASHELAIDQNSGPHRANVYRVLFRQGAVDDRVPLCQGDADAPPEGDISSPEGDIHDAQRVTPTSPKPSRNRHKEPSEEPSEAGLFGSGFEALAMIPKYRPDPARDGPLVEWLVTHEISPEVFLRSATALAGNWPPRRSKKPDPWLQVRTYCLNQKKWDTERGGRNGHIATDATKNPFELEAEQERARLDAGDERRRAAGLPPLPRFRVAQA